MKDSFTRDEIEHLFMLKLSRTRLADAIGVIESARGFLGRTSKRWMPFEEFVAIDAYFERLVAEAMELHGRIAPHIEMTESAKGAAAQADGEP